MKEDLEEAQPKEEEEIKKENSFFQATQIQQVGPAVQPSMARAGGRAVA